MNDNALMDSRGHRATFSTRTELLDPSSICTPSLLECAGTAGFGKPAEARQMGMVADAIGGVRQPASAFLQTVPGASTDPTQHGSSHA